MLFGKNKKNNKFREENKEVPDDISGVSAASFGNVSDGIDTSALFGPAPYESDWKPFVQYIDEEDITDGIEAIREEEFDFSDESEETDNQINEKEDKEEQHALGGENTDSVGEGEARYDGGSPEAAQGYQSAEGNGLLETGGYSGGSGAETQEQDQAKEKQAEMPAEQETKQESKQEPKQESKRASKKTLKTEKKAPKKEKKARAKSRKKKTVILKKQKSK